MGAESEFGRSHATDVGTESHTPDRSRRLQVALAVSVLVALIASGVAIHGSRVNATLRDQLLEAESGQDSLENLQARHALEQAQLHETLQVAREHAAQCDAQAKTVRARLQITSAVMDALLESVPEDAFEPLPEVLHHRATLLQAAARGYQQLLELAPDDPQTVLNAIRCQRALGDTCRQLNRPELAGTTYAQCLQLLADVLQDRPADPELDEQVARLRYRLAESLTAAGRHQDADKLLHLALNGFVKLSDSQPENTRFRFEQARIHCELARLSAKRGENDRVENELLIALAIQQEVVEADPGSTEYRHFLAQCHADAAAAAVSGTRESHLQTAVAELESLLKHEPKPEYRRDLALVYRQQAQTLKATRADDDAVIEAFQNALSHLQTLVSDAPVRYELESLLAATHQDLAKALTATGQVAESTEHWRDALGIRTALAVRFPDRETCLQDLAEVHFRCGILHEQQGRLPAAADHFRAAREALLRVDALTVSRDSERSSDRLSTAIRKLREHEQQIESLSHESEIRPAAAVRDDGPIQRPETTD